ncbi:MFS transporter [Nonomuraea sp. NN258]|uniref:MFS transporter n=1 Tax=Nonomuraea antri TaxID=2730852 RepID=UPI001568A408|nr:MFS transporter [Nonomuraea antri]NRQ36746.1 MFS transporter [Nonomuraea antri]
MVTTTAARAGRREWTGLAVLALPTLLLSLDVSVLYLALPHLSADLGADSAQQLWIMDIYSFMLAGFLVTMGTLGDRIGRRRLLLIGAAAFGVASILAAYSNSAEMLIVTRALLGIAGATLMPSTMALIRNMFADPKQMATAISVWFSCFMGGLALGPLVGGLLLEHFWWGSAFLVGVPVMALLLVFGPALLPEYRDSTAGRLDLTSVALYLLAILPLIYGLKDVSRYGPQPVSLAAVAAGLAFGAAFVRRQRTLAHPMLDPRLFSNRAFTASIGVMLLGGVVMAAVTLTSTQYLQLVQGLSPMAAGLWLIPQNLAMIGCTLLAPVLARRIRPVRVMASGLAMAALGCVLHALVDPVGGLPLLVAGLVLASAGIALPMPLTTSIMMSAAPPEKAGSVASLSETGGEFGIAVGLATLGSLLTFVFRAELPADAPEQARAGITSAMTLPDLVDAARAAFTSGLNVVAVAGAIIFAALTVVTALMLRRTA